MNSFDAPIILFLNHFAQRSWTFDTLMFFVGDSHLLKGYMIVALIWWAWHAPGNEQETNRKFLLVTLVISLLSVAISQILQLRPLRIRPMYEEVLHFRTPFSIPTGYLQDLRSFPSDHATLFFSLATGLMFVSPLLGWIALGHAVFIVSLPRIYLGFHYPTDIVAGFLLGSGLTYLSCSSGFLTESVGRIGLDWERRYRGIFYMGLFVYTSLLATLFEPARAMLKFSVGFLIAVWGRSAS